MRRKWAEANSLFSKKSEKACKKEPKKLLNSQRLLRMSCLEMSLLPPQKTLAHLSQVALASRPANTMDLPPSHHLNQPHPSPQRSPRIQKSAKIPSRTL